MAKLLPQPGSETGVGLGWRRRRDQHEMETEKGHKLHPLHQLMSLSVAVFSYDAHLMPTLRPRPLTEPTAGTAPQQTNNWAATQTGDRGQGTVDRCQMPAARCQGAQHPSNSPQAPPQAPPLSVRSPSFALFPPAAIACARCAAAIVPHEIMLAYSAAGHFFFFAPH